MNYRHLTIMALNLLVILVLLSSSIIPPGDRIEGVRAFTRDIEFDFVGWTLDAAVRKHGVFKLLRASRLPARAAGLSELQGFLERGFAAFEALGGAGDFLETIGRREREVSRRLFADAPDPFGTGPSRTPGRGSGGSRARSGP